MPLECDGEQILANYPYPNNCDAIPLIGADMAALARRGCGCVQTVPAETLPESFLELAWPDGLPTASECPILTVLEGCNIWQAVNDPDNCDLGTIPATPGTGEDWQQVGGPGSSATDLAAAGVVFARLTAQSGVPIPSTDQTDVQNIYLTPYRGNIVELWDDINLEWVPVLFSEITIPVPNHTNRCFDIFAYLNAGVVAIETVDWNAPSTGVITAATNATPISITSAGHGLSDDMLVTITGATGNTAANGTWRIDVIDVNTFTLKNLDNTNSSGNGVFSGTANWERADQNTSRATAITLEDGRYVKSGDKTRLLLGTGRTGTTAGRLTDGESRRRLSNVYNRVARTLSAVIPASSYTASSTVVPANNTLAFGESRVDFVNAIDEEPIYYLWNCNCHGGNNSGAFAQVLLALDNTTNQDADSASRSTFDGPAVALINRRMTVGYHFIQKSVVRGGTATTATYTGINVSGTNVVVSRAKGWIWA